MVVYIMLTKHSTKDTQKITRELFHVNVKDKKNRLISNNLTQLGTKTMEHTIFSPTKGKNGSFDNNYL